jgi:hypothetical protein
VSFGSKPRQAGPGDVSPVSPSNKAADEYDWESLFRDDGGPIKIPPPGKGMFADVEFEGPEDRERCHRFLMEIEALCREDELRTRARMRRLRQLLDQQAIASEE